MSNDCQNEITFNVCSVIPTAELDRDVTRKVWYFHDRSATTRRNRNLDGDDLTPRTTFAIVMLNENEFVVARSIHNPNDIYANVKGTNFDRNRGRSIARGRIEHMIFGKNAEPDQFMTIMNRNNLDNTWGLDPEWLSHTFDRIIASSKRYEAKKLEAAAS